MPRHRSALLVWDGRLVRTNVSHETSRRLARLSSGGGGCALFGFNALCVSHVASLRVRPSWCSACGFGARLTAGVVRCRYGVRVALNAQTLPRRSHRVLFARLSCLSCSRVSRLALLAYRFPFARTVRAARTLGTVRHDGGVGFDDGVQLVDVAQKQRARAALVVHEVAHLHRLVHVERDARDA